MSRKNLERLCALPGARLQSAPDKVQGLWNFEGIDSREAINFAVLTRRLETVTTPIAYIRRTHTNPRIWPYAITMPGRFISGTNLPTDMKEHNS